MQFRFKGCEGKTQHTGVVNGVEVQNKDLVKGDVVTSDADLSKSLPDRFELIAEADLPTAVEEDETDDQVEDHSNDE